MITNRARRSVSAPRTTPRTMNRISFCFDACGCVTIWLVDDEIGMVRVGLLLGLFGLGLPDRSTVSDNVRP